MSRILPIILWLVAVGCSSEHRSPGPFAQVEEAIWRQVNQSHQGSDGIFVQVELRTFGYEIASAYAQAERQGLSQEHLESRLTQFIHSYIDGTYPVEDGTDINNLYFQYLIYVNPHFDVDNPLQRQVFENWRTQFVRRLIDLIYDPVQPVLRNHYDERWGLTLFSRLVFIVYLNNEESTLAPPIADIGARTLLVDEEGNRYTSSGLTGPYLYETDRPGREVLDGETVYRVLFPNRQVDLKQPIVTPLSRHIELHIEGLGEVPVRRLRWNLPFQYPILPQRRLPSEQELAERKKAVAG